MSDSDWSDDDDADVLMPGEVKQAPTPEPDPVVAQPKPAHAEAKQEGATVAPLRPEKAQAPTPAKPEIVMALPVVVYLTASSPGKAAGVSVLADAALATFSFLVYDQNRRTLVYEPVATTSSSSALAKPSEWTGEPALPFSLKLDGVFSEGRLKLLDKDKRWWILAFTSRAHCLRFLCFYLLTASLAARDGVSCKQLTLVAGDRSGKRAKSYAAVNMQCWTVSASIESLKALDTALDPLAPTSAPRVEDVKITDRKESEPTTLGQALNRLRVGTKLLLATPLDSPLAQDLAYLQGVAHDPSARALVVYVEIADVYKKRRHKKRSKVVSPAAAIPVPTSVSPAPSSPPLSTSPEPVPPAQDTLSADPGPNPPDQPQAPAPQPQTQPQPPLQAPPPVPYAEPPPSHAAMEAAPVTALVPVPDDQGLSFEDEFTEVCQTIESVQDKILKRTLNDMYLRVVASLDLDADVDEDSTVPSSQVLDVIRTSMREAIAGFVDYNKNDVPGTIASVTSLQPKLKSRVAPGTAPSAADTGNQVAALEAKVSRLEKELNYEKVKHAQAIKAKDELGMKQMKLATDNMDLEAKLDAARANAAKYKAQADELKVFEQATSEMRKLLDSEIEARQETEDSFDQLLRQQNKFKLNWYPKKDVSHCLLCGDAFKMFGAKSRQHCRHCGRVFCKPCSRHEIELPEIGFKKPVRVCTWCYEFKTGERIGNDAVEEVAAPSAPDGAAPQQDRKSFLSGLTADYSDDGF